MFRGPTTRRNFLNLDETSFQETSASKFIIQYLTFKCMNVPLIDNCLDGDQLLHQFDIFDQSGEQGQCQCIGQLSNFGAESSLN